MKRKSTTRNALFTSIISLLLCVSMLVGTTFAWFTDTVQSGNNIIVAGNLDIDVMYANAPDGTYASIENVADLFVAPAGATKGLWEPGHTEVAYLKVVNNGTLALKYQFMVDAASEVIGKSVLGNDIKLSEILKFAATEPSVTAPAEYDRATAQAAAEASDSNLLGYTTETKTLAPGEAHYIALVVYMPETIGNEANYRGGAVPTINFKLTALATQVEAENDSFGDDYDEDAWVDGMKVYSARDLQNAIDAGETAIILMNDVDADDTIVIADDVKIDLNGKTLTGSVEIKDGAKAEIKNGKIDNANADVSGIQVGAGELTLNEVEITSARHAVRVEGAGVVTINGGTYKAGGSRGKTQHALNISDGGEVIINGGTFIGPKGTDSDSGSAVNVQAGSKVTINGGNFSGGKSKTLSGGDLTVNGGTFDQNPAAYVAAGNHVVDSNNLFYVVPEEVDDVITSAADLQAALDAATAGDNVLVLAADITGNVIVTQKEGVNIVIDGAGYEYNGSIEIYGSARATGAETLTFRNINFVTDETVDFIHCNSTESAKRYAHNVTVDGCTFTAAGEGLYTAVGLRMRQCYNITVKNSTFTGMHSATWANGCNNGLTFDALTITNCKNGISAGTSAEVTVKNSTIESVVDYGYGIRVDASGAYNLTVENCTIQADAAVLIRKATGAYTAALTGNTLEGKVIMTNSDYEEGTALTAPTGNLNVTIDGKVAAAPATVQALIDNGETAIILTAGEYGTIIAKSNITIEGTEGAVVGCINLNGSSNVTLKNITFDAAGAQMAYDGKGTARQNANIINADASKPKIGARNIVIDGCTFTGTFANGGAAIAFVDRSRTTGGSGDITIQNCTFNTEGAYYDVYGYYTGLNGLTFTIKNNTFKSDCPSSTIYMGRIVNGTRFVVDNNKFMTADAIGDAVFIQNASGNEINADSAVGNTFGA